MSQVSGDRVLVGAVALAEAGGAALSRYLRADIATQYMPLAISTVTLVAVAVVPGVFTAAVVLLALLMGASEPLRATAIQMLVESRRAEAASWASAVDGVVRTLTLLLAGAWRRPR